MSCTLITTSELSRLIGLPQVPAILDVRTDNDFHADPRLLPASQRMDFRAIAQWSAVHKDNSVVVVCHKGRLSQGTAAWLRHEGIDAETLEGGFEAWKDNGELLVHAERLPPRDAKGGTLWVTRSRPKIDRIACPWLIRRFVDPNAIFLFVSASEVMNAAERFNATPFDIEGVFWSHRGDTCTFDTMIEEFGLRTQPLRHLAKIVRGADTARPDLIPECAGLLAASLGYSHMFKDDLPQLEAEMALYDAFYRWCRDARDETHNWPSQKPN